MARLLVVDDEPGLRRGLARRALVGRPRVVGSCGADLGQFLLRLARGRQRPAGYRRLYAARAAW